MSTAHPRSLKLIIAGAAAQAIGPILFVATAPDPRLPGNVLMPMALLVLIVAVLTGTSYVRIGNAAVGAPWIPRWVMPTSVIACVGLLTALPFSLFARTGDLPTVAAGALLAGLAANHVFMTVMSLHGRHGLARRTAGMIALAQVAAVAVAGTHRVACVASLLAAAAVAGGLLIAELDPPDRHD